jgi:hypothetical protein
MTRCASAGGNMSRITARETTMPAPVARPLQRPEKDQVRDVGGQRTAHRGQREHRHPGQHHRPASEAVGQRAVKQAHEGEREQIGRQGLLDLQRRGLQIGRNARKCR